jgi:hypothetical protein
MIDEPELDIGAALLRSRMRMKVLPITADTTDAQLREIAAEFARQSKLNERKLRRELVAVRDALRLQRDTTC